LKPTPQDDVSHTCAGRCCEILLLKTAKFAPIRAILRVLVAGWSAISTYGTKKTGVYAMTYFKFLIQKGAGIWRLK
ncbi:MAG: hypothetical protein QGH07_16355, partial [Alphaproteobacteria bacterium]|nr:hypothetical protein [Alphaproteobacteria bacterium]